MRIENTAVTRKLLHNWKLSFDRLFQKQLAIKLYNHYKNHETIEKMRIKNTIHDIYLCNVFRSILSRAAVVHLNTDPGQLSGPSLYCT